MDYIKLKNLNKPVSRLCFGTLTMAPQQLNLPPEKGAELLTYAFSKGINFLDTAQFYENYQHIGLALKNWGRDDIVISTKTYAYTKELAWAAVDEARRALNRDYIDIFMLHEQESIHTLRGHFEALEHLLNLRSRGIIGAVGLSTHHIALVRDCIGFSDIDILHPILNIGGLGILDGEKDEMEDALKLAKAHGISIFSMKPFGGGHLFKRAEECLCYLQGLPFVDAIAIGMQSLEEIDANLSFFEKGYFPSESLKILAEKKRRLLIMDWCEGCAECISACPFGALSIEGGRAVLAQNMCMLCGYCAKSCKNGCLKVI